MATFSWGNQTWGPGDLDSFISYLSAHGTDYSTWAANHPDAAAVFTGGSSSSPDAPVPKPGQSVTAPASPAAPPPTSGDTGGGDDTGGDSGGGSTIPPPQTQYDASTWDSLLGETGMPSDVIANLNQILSTSLNPDGSINTSEAVELAQAYVRGTSWYAQTYPGIQQGIDAGLFNDESGYMAYENQVNQIYQQYWGRPATSAELNAHITSGQSVSQISNQFQSGAIQQNFSDPLKAIFTTSELQAFANEQAGIDTALGQKISAEANLFTGVNQLYENFYGTGVTRAQLDQLTSQGTDAATVAQQFAVQSNINAMNPAIADLFTPAEIQQIALEAAGGTTQNGKQLTDLANLATQLNPIYHEETGNGLSRDELNSAYSSGYTPTQIQNQLQGNNYAAANAPDIQQTEGSFGTGQLSATDLQTLGQEASGFDTPQGQVLLTAYQKAQQRLAGAFKGTLANPSVTALLNAGAQKTPDVAAS